MLRLNISCNGDHSGMVSNMRQTDSFDRFQSQQAPQAVLLFPKNANLQDIDGRSQMGSGFSSL